MTDSFRCKFCEAILDTATKLQLGDCGCRWQHGDIVLNPLTGRLLLAEYDKYAKRVQFTEYMPIGAESQDAPAGAVLVCRTVDGKRVPVTDFGDGEMYSVRPVAS